MCLLLQTLNIPTNNKYDSYTSGHVRLEFLWANSNYISDGVLTKTQSSPF